MEASPCRFASERYWTEEKERTLIAFFSKHSCLWNHKSENYKNRQLRWKTLEHLRILLSSQPPPAPFTVEDIKNKFKNLRTTFQRQSKLVRASKESSSEPFVPQWKHYQQLKFLQDCWDQDNGPEEPPLSPLADPPEENKPTLTPTGLISFLPSTTASSCVPSNILVKSYWTEDRERALISFYAEHSCLWSKKSENHNNRQLRQKLLESLRSRLSDQLVSFSVDDIKCKFKNLRTVFNREHKSMQASRVLDKPYVSKWKHYHHLLFLCESGDEDESPEDLQILMMHEAKDLENGSPAPSSTLSSFSSSSIQTNNNNKLNTLVLSRSSQSESQTSTSTGYQILLPAAPDHLKPDSHMVVSTLSDSPSRSLPDRKSNGNPSLLSASCLVQPKVRLTSDSRCLWSEAKVQQLISFYSEHSCLWNHKLDSYRNRVLRQSLLERLSGLLSEHEPVPFSVEDIKTKFRNLRTIFQREHKAVSSNRTCGSEDFYLPKWKHYHDLMFLCDSCDEDDEQPEESGLLRFDNLSPSLHYPFTNQTAPNLTTARQSPEAPLSPTPPDSQLCSPSSSPSKSSPSTSSPSKSSPSTSSPSKSSPSTSSPSKSSSHVDSRVSGRKRAGCRLWASTSELMRSVCQNRTESPHAGFLKYVEECLNETPPDKVKKLKKMIIETIHSVAEDV